MTANIFTSDASGEINHAEIISAEAIAKACKDGGSILIISARERIDSLLTMRKIIEDELVCRAKITLENLTK